jgi:hypothetical protein
MERQPPGVDRRVSECASDIEAAIAHGVIGAPLSLDDAAVLGDHLRELGVAEWRVAALGVLTRGTP